MGKSRVLLAMSTINSREAGKFSPNEYKIKGTNEPISGCYGQLEPVPKLLMKQGELDIIVLCTQDTYVQEVAICVNDEIKNSGQPVPHDGTYTAVSFFVARLIQESAPDELNMDDIKRSFAPEIMEKEYLEGNISEYHSKKISFHFIPISLEEPGKGIRKAVDYIRKCHQEEAENNKVPLYIDTHGGLRDVSQSMTAIISLLKVYDIEPAKIWGIYFGGERNMLVEQDKSYKMFEFVAGMNEFIQFGSPNALKEYFDGQNDEQTQKLLDAMGQVSDGIKMCDPKEYEKGLDQLGEVINSGTSFENEWISIFIDYIKQQYGVLLDSNQRTSLDIVRFCYRKEQYQQALTFIESRMPEYFHDKGVLYYAKNTEETDAEGKDTKKIIGKIKDKTPYDYKEVCNFTFDNFLSKKASSYFSNEKRKELLKNKPANVKERDYLAVEAIKDVDSLLTDFINCNSDSVVVFIENKQNGKYVKIGEVEVYTLVSSEEKKRNKVGRLLRLHNALKNCRNVTNHATDGLHPKINDLRTAIETYIEWTTSVVGDIDINRVRQTTSAKTKCYIEPKLKSQENKDPKIKKDETSPKNIKDNLELEVVTVKGSNKTLRGNIWKNGKRIEVPQGIQGGVISTKNTGLEREDLELLKGRRIPVRLRAKGEVWYTYESKKPLRTYLKS